MWLRYLFVAALVAAWPAAASAQYLPSRPLTLVDGRLVVGGDVSGSIAAVDEGYFNYTDYDHNALRLFRASVSASFRLSDRVSLLGEVRTENLDRLHAYAWYVRVRPWRNRAIDVQAGRIPPVFGAYSRRNYGQDLLIGYPLAYQYLTSLRADALPDSEADLLRTRGDGWGVRYPIGATSYVHGLPLVAASRWDTGIQVTGDNGIVAATGAVTVGSLSNPRVRDDNDGKQVVGRVMIRPSPALTIGVSGARGAYLARSLTNTLPMDEREGNYTQDAVGADVELSRDYWLVRAEAVFTRWHMPAVGTFTEPPRLAARAVSVEGRYKIYPGLYVAARVDHLGFSQLQGSASSPPLPWDAPVTRLEAGGGYQIARNLLAKATVQFNHRDGGLVTSGTFTAAQLQFWF